MIYTFNRKSSAFPGIPQTFHFDTGSWSMLFLIKNALILHKSFQYVNLSFI